MNYKERDFQTIINFWCGIRMLGDLEDIANKERLSRSALIRKILGKYIEIYRANEITTQQKIDQIFQRMDLM